MGVPALLAFLYLVASRLAYVVGVGYALREQDRHQIFTRRYGIEAGWERFKRFAAPIMINDGFAFVVLCAVTMNTLHTEIPRVLLVVVGLVIGVLGIAVKVWATATLGGRAYYWHNFFAPDDAPPPSDAGPYRYFRNPMYGVGYLQTYGLALVCASLPGLVGAAFMHLGILAFNHFVEKPHFEMLHEATAQR
jgi:protein-S-isoprenylcysteine O-methyltransferase Ste14